MCRPDAPLPRGASLAGCDRMAPPISPRGATCTRRSRTRCPGSDFDMHLEIITVNRFTSNEFSNLARRRRAPVGGVYQHPYNPVRAPYAGDALPRGPAARPWKGSRSRVYASRSRLPQPQPAVPARHRVDVHLPPDPVPHRLWNMDHSDRPTERRPLPVPQEPVLRG